MLRHRPTAAGLPTAIDCCQPLPTLPSVLHHCRSPWSAPEYAGLLVECSRKGLLSLAGFQALWAYTTALEPRRALAYAYYLG